MGNKYIFDVELLADKIMAMLGVKPGQVIWIWGSVYSMDLIEALAFHIRARGAFWLLRLSSESLLHRIGMEMPRKYLGILPEHELRWLDDVDVIVELRDHSGHIPDVPLERRRAMGSEWIALIEAAARKNIRRVMVVNPTPALAAALHLPLDELQKRLMRAINVDYVAVDRRQEQIARLLKSTREVHITSEIGTDLHLRVDGRSSLLDLDSLPRGEAYIAPLENSAEGMAVIEKAFFMGRFVEQLCLTFSGGRVVHVKAHHLAGVKAFRELLVASNGDKDYIAEFAIGTNPGVTEPIGYISLDEKIGGSVHIAIGMNENFGGRNRSNLHLDLVIQKPTVHFDGKVVLKYGKFKV
jgi:aminopeptidase